MGSENHAPAVALRDMCQDSVRILRLLRVTPAMQASLTDRAWSIGDIIGLLDAAEREPVA